MTTVRTYQYPRMTKERYKAPLTDLVQLPEEVEPIDKDVRGITPETYALYGVKFYDDGILYPYQTDGKLIGYKVRTRDKSFPWSGENSAVTMFKPTTQMSGDKYLIITEGEQDAMALHQMLGYTVWSVPFGATSAVKYIKRTLREIDRYDQVVLAFDNDDPGKKATEDCLEVLDPSKTKVMSFPHGIKDANDLLLHWDRAPDHQRYKSAEDYARALWWGAKAPLIDGVVDTYDAVRQAQEWYFNPEDRIGLPTGYSGLDKLIGGWRGGEFIVLVGGTGSSKSTTTRQLLMRQHEADVETCLITLEDTIPLAVVRFVEINQRKELIRASEERITREQFSLVAQDLEGIHLVDGMQLRNLSEGITRAISHHARIGVKFFVIDHLTAVSDSLELRQFNQFIRELYHLAGRHNVCIVGISHMSRDKQDSKDNDPTLARIKNSSGISQWATAVMGLTRERGSNRVKLSTLKQSRTWGVHGETWFLYNSDTVQLEECDPPLEEDEFNNEETKEQW